jgi:hypothetical protein
LSTDDNRTLIEATVSNGGQSSSVCEDYGIQSNNTSKLIEGGILDN